MCLSQPARIVAIEGADAVVEIDGRRRRASLLRGPAVDVGDWALVAAGSVIRRLGAEEAAALAELLRPARLAALSIPDRAHASTTEELR